MSVFDTRDGAVDTPDEPVDAPEDDGDASETVTIVEGHAVQFNEYRY
ncbi:hypothetical protein GRS48_02285 [Halorubrum sp. JWXQ-INN 858]|nr:hypothetical protein [Halorubrum sp. JWXQ-INN 858]MWV63656.1 hypothetical protein [Halorubrum sp. JWXQ-INN 858]